MSDVLYHDLRVTPSELRAIEKLREQREQGFACDDGIVRCGPCMSRWRLRDAPSGEREEFTPQAFDGDDFCSDCDGDIKAKDYPDPEEVRA